MVFRGRPSTGCKKCRVRKIKCDERPEACRNCSEKGFPCPGYDTSLDRFFLDQSTHTAERAKKLKAKAIVLRDTRDRKVISQKSKGKVHESLELPLLCPLIDQGIAFFMSHYALGLDQPPMQSEAYHKHLSTQGFHPIIATSMTALGLAGIANINMNMAFKKEATQWYLKAIKMTNTALASATEVKSDNTLLATMLLSIFEATNNEASLDGWVSHVEGSASLLKIRGIDQFETPAGRRMYWQTVGLLAMNCMGKGEELPLFVNSYNRESEKYRNGADPMDRYFQLHIEVVNFRGQVLNKRIVGLQDIIERALEVDGAATRVFENVAQEWEYEEVTPDNDIPGVFGKCYHVYEHMASAQTWNWMRYNRIYLHDIIRNCVITGFSTIPPVFSGEKYTHLLEESTRTIQNMQAGIFASTPQHLNDTPKHAMKYRNNIPGSMDTDLPQTHLSISPSPNNEPKFIWSNFREAHHSPKKPTANATPKDRLPIVRVCGGYSSLWALFIAGATPIATPESQEYVLKSFEKVEKRFGISQARVLANLLRFKMHLDAIGETPFEIVPAYLPSIPQEVSPL